MDDFPCTKCGECCRQIANLTNPSNPNFKSFPTAIQDLISIFPYESKPDGSCSMLDDNGLCSVYDSRPIICNIKLAAQLFNLPILEYYRMNATYCNYLIDKAGLSHDYYVKIEESSEKINQTYDEGRIGPRKKRKRKTSQKSS